MEKKQLYQSPLLRIYALAPHAPVLLNTSETEGVTSTKWNAEESAFDEWD